jgi:cytochrome c biogenesis protein
MENENSTSSKNALWEFFSSIQLTVIILLTLAGASIVGTLIPQNQNSADYVHTYGETLYRIFYALDIFDMYHSWWFQSMLILLTLNILICSIDRLSTLWKTLFIKEPPFRLSTFQNLTRKQEASLNLTADEAKQITEPLISRAFSYTRSEKTESGFCIFAEKGRWTRLGVYIVHLSVMLLLTGGVIGSFFGFEGFVNIPEGEKVNAIRLRDSDKFHTLDFEIRCDDFEVSFYENKMPKEYRSRLVILENGNSVFEKDILVNHPLRYKGINIFQSSYGTMPLDAGTVRENGITLTFTSIASGLMYPVKAVLGQPAEIPEGGGSFVLKDVIPSYVFMGQRDLGETLVGVLTPINGGPVEVNLPLRFPDFDKMMHKMGGGRNFIISVTGYAQRYYTGLQITRDPGVPMVYAGFILMIIGCFVTFFMSHQRICVELIAHKGICRMVISGTANKNQMGLEEQMDRICRDIVRLTPEKLVRDRAGEMG